MTVSTALSMELSQHLHFVRFKLRAWSGKPMSVVTMAPHEHLARTPQQSLTRLGKGLGRPKAKSLGMVQSRGLTFRLLPQTLLAMTPLGRLGSRIRGFATFLPKMWLSILRTLNVSYEEFAGEYLFCPNRLLLRFTSTAGVS